MFFWGKQTSPFPLILLGAHRSAQPDHAGATTSEPEQRPAPPKRAAHYLWAVLIARIYEVFPQDCPICGGQMRIIAFVTHSADVRPILDHIGVDSELPQITPARGPPLWEVVGTPVNADGEA